MFFNSVLAVVFVLQDVFFWMTGWVCDGGGRYIRTTRAACYKLNLLLEVFGQGLSCLSLWFIFLKDPCPDLVPSIKNLPGSLWWQSGLCCAPFTPCATWACPMPSSVSATCRSAAAWLSHYNRVLVWITNCLRSKLRTVTGHVFLALMIKREHASLQAPSMCSNPENTLSNH